jgi:putative transposase
MHDLLVASWERADAWRVGRYVVLPDHVHLFASPNGFDAVPVRQWVSYWKSVVTRHLPEEPSGSIWQRDLWDRQLRSGDSYAVKWEYVRSNPVRHELIEKAEDWPYQGELHQLPWHD